MGCNPPVPASNGGIIPGTLPITINPIVPDQELPVIPGTPPSYIYLTFPPVFVPSVDPDAYYGNPDTTYNFTCSIGSLPVQVFIPANTYRVLGSQAYANYLADQAAQQAANLACAGGGGGNNPAIGDFGNDELTGEVTCP
jgi:hypothetical protein